MTIATRRRFVGEPIQPVAGSFDPAPMSRGEPSPPGRFHWRSTEYVLAEVLEAWKPTRPCRHGSGEQYVAQHRYRIRTTSGHEMELYFERQPRSGARGKARRQWRLYTVTETEG